MIQLFRVVISEQIIDNSEPVKCKRRTTLGKSLLFSRVLYREWWPATYCSRVSGYRDILPELDLVLWLIKADDRALSVDEYFWRHILQCGHQQVLFVVTQADKTEPCHEWDMAGIQPSPAQAQNIREKTEAVFRLFRPVHPVVAVSARTGWELDTLVSALMTALPDHTASPLMTRLQDELRTESVRSQAREQFTGAVDRIFDTAESVCIASVARTVLRAVRDTVVSVARAVWNWIFF